MKAVAHVHWTPARAGGTDVWREWASRAVAILVATMICIAAVAFSSAIAPAARAHGAASAASDRRYWTAAERARRDAERCAGELRAIAERHAILAARALDVGEVPAAPSGPAIRAIEARRDVVERAADAVAALRGTGATDAAAEQLARAHRAAETLCDAREAASAASSAGALAMRRLASAAGERP
jgi:hypothetical protein